MIRHDAYRAAARFRRLGQSDELVQRIVSPALMEAADEAFKIARRNRFGFVNRTGRLRRSLRIEQARDARGRFATSIQLVASTPYAAFVEFKARSRDRRPGPPYWLARAFRLARNRIRRRIRAGIRARLRQSFERGSR